MRSMILTENSFPLGENFFPLLLLALGGALVVGTTLALVRPPANPKEGALEKPPMLRSIVQIVLGLAMVIWAIATMLI